ncbi:hypothetical protein SAMN04487996_101393 [Dyadobacter soli]|uniref:Uncharacterized protein n=1 Tax=Dyadobacter soli TaxID=659014 RepID=A0A1G6W0B7_9BACT|nr:hypothetical protein [Dyadobacter soli]SDD59249.1 hypothetical protein SAMN04487996_101393 [Dyadobacter soli]
MVEVFKTNVGKHSQARLLVDLICLAFNGYRASFDLEDCDKVLRVSCESNAVCNASITGLLESFGYEASVMKDEYSGNALANTASNSIHSITI